MTLLIVQIIMSLILIPKLAVFSSEPLSNSGSSGWEDWECTTYSAYYIFTAGKKKGNLPDPVWCVKGRKKPKPAYFSLFLQRKDINEFQKSTCKSYSMPLSRLSP